MKLPREQLTQAILKRYLRCDRKTKTFTWRIDRYRVKVGDEAGYYDPINGYVVIRLFQTLYPAHHLVWLYYKGALPESELDHKNGIRHDNRLSNLRPCNDLEQQQNRAPNKNNKSGHPNVYWCNTFQKWHVRIRAENRCNHIGYFKDFEVACTAAKEAKAKFHTFNPVHRKNVYERLHP